jgi:hypothetical protein
MTQIIMLAVISSSSNSMEWFGIYADNPERSAQRWKGQQFAGGLSGMTTNIK